MEQISHLDQSGRARMVDVSAKPTTLRSATARAHLICSLETLDRVREHRAPKGAVISTAELAGVMAAKQTSALIPLCHPLPLSKASVEIDMDPGLPGFHILGEARTESQTGVEMEALTAVSVAALTLYDMLKAIDKHMRIEGITLIAKSGGRSDFGTLTRLQQCE